MVQLLLAMLLVASAATAEVFKWVDAQGRTQFSDRPQPDAQAMELQDHKPADRRDQPVTPDNQPQAPLLGPYTGFEFVSPEPNQTLRLSQESLPISLIIEPPLIAGHKLELVLDGAPIGVEKSGGTQLTLNGVAYGSHQIHGEIKDSQGTTVARTAPVSFHLRKPLPPGVLP